MYCDDDVVTTIGEPSNIDYAALTMTTRYDMAALPMAMRELIMAMLTMQH